MSASNGRLPASDLAPIPGGELRKDAAAAWNASGGPADAGLRPGGSMSSYRTYSEQEYLYQLYVTGQGNLAATPGTSNHGYGIAIDLPYGWEQDWMREHGHEYGFAKTEAFSEPWHWNYVGGVSFPTFESLEKGDKGDRVERFTRKLTFIRKPAGRRYLLRSRHRYGRRVAKAVVRFQKDHGLTPDGVIGPKTGAKINGVFKRQYRKRGKA